MLNRVFNPVVRSLVLRPRNVLAPTVRFLQPNYKSTHPPTTMDDMPIPCGDWEAQYKANQTKYHMQIAVGIVSLVVTIVAAKASGLLYLNYYPPEYPKDD